MSNDTTHRDDLADGQADERDSRADAKVADVLEALTWHEEREAELLRKRLEADPEFRAWFRLVHD